MSKSRGNTVDPDALFTKYGADVVRWNLLCSRPLWLSMRFDERDLVETRNRFFGTLASTYHFFALYANSDGWRAEDEAAAKPSTHVLDRWLLSRLDGLVQRVGEDVAAYETSRAGRAIVDFVVEDLSNWYVRRNRRRFWKGALTEDKRAAYRTLRDALVGVSRLMAPFAPFLADAVHRALHPGASGAGASVHLAAWPTPVDGRSDSALEERMEALRTVVSLGHASRNRAGRKVRQPLGSLAVGGASGAVLDFLRDNADTVREELNVRRLVFEDDLAARTRFRVALDKKEAARRLGPRTQAVEQALAALSEDAARALVVANGERRVRTKDGEDVALSAGEVRVETVDAEGSASAFGGGLVVRLDTTLTPDLVAEGLVREFVHAVQALRKAAGLAVTDRVRLRWSANGPLAEALRAHRAYVAEELLAVEVLEGPAPEGERVEVDGHEARVRLERAG